MNRSIQCFLLTLFAACFTPCRQASANVYLVGETHAGTQAVLFLDYNTYGAGTILFASSLTLRYKDGEVETLPFRMDQDESGDPAAIPARVIQAATHDSLKSSGVHHFTLAFEGRWENQGGGGTIVASFAGPSNSQKGVADIDRANETNEMVIKWNPGNGWPLRGKGELSFKKLKLYGWNYDEAYPEGFDEKYADEISTRVEKLLLPFIENHPEADSVFSDGERPVSSYLVRHDPTDGSLFVQMTWWARFGRTLDSVRLADLDLESVVLEEETGGAFGGSTAMTLSTKEGKKVAYRSWSANAKEIKDDLAVTTGESDAVVIHFESIDHANRALSKLRELAR